jgi:hypothetical protein
MTLVIHHTAIAQNDIFFVTAFVHSAFHFLKGMLCGQASGHLCGVALDDLANFVAGRGEGDTDAVRFSLG